MKNIYKNVLNLKKNLISSINLKSWIIRIVILSH